MTKYLNGFVLWYHRSHIVLYTPEWLGFVVYSWAGRRCFYISPDATPSTSWLYIGAAEHRVHLTAYRRGYAAVAFVVVALLAVFFYIIGGR